MAGLDRHSLVALVLHYSRLVYMHVQSRLIGPHNVVVSAIHNVTGFMGSVLFVGITFALGSARSSRMKYMVQSMTEN